MENLLKVHGLKMTQGAGWQFLPMEVCSPREGDSGRSSPRCSAGAVKEAFRGYTEFVVPLWTHWGAMRSPSPGASGAEQVEVVMT